MNTVSFPKLGWSFEVNSRAFTLFGFEVYWYGVIIALGVMLAVAYALSKSKKVGLDADRVIDVIIGGFIGGIIGARLYYVLFSWALFADDWTKIFDIREGGLAIYGGLLGGIGVGLLIAKLRKVRMLPMLDLAAYGFLIGQGIGRWGNFFNVEAYGSPTSLPWGMSSDKITTALSGLYAMPAEGELAVHPTFLYESLWCLLGFLLLHLYFKHRKYDGQLFLMYATWYSAERVLVEGLRTDSLMLGPFRVSQLLSGLILVAAVATMIIVAINRKADPKPLYVDTEESKQLLAQRQTDKAKTVDETPVSTLELGDVESEAADALLETAAEATETQVQDEAVDTVADAIEHETIEEEQNDGEDH